MTNYPRDEFDRVPEFNTRVGSHHANGWAQAAASNERGGKFRWVALAAVAALLVGAVSYFLFGPSAQGQLLGSTPTASPTTASTESGSPEPSPSPTPSPSSTIDDAEVMFDQVVGLYNGAGVGGVAGQASDLLAENDFTRTYTDDWVRIDPVSAVYYNAETYRVTAEKIAELLGIEDVYQTTNIPNRLTVVIGQDNPLPEPSADASESASPELSGTE